MKPKASEIIADRIPDATLEFVPGCGHWIQIEAPDTLLEALDRWQSAGPATTEE